MFLLFWYFTAYLTSVYFHPPGAETLKLSIGRQTDRQTDSVGGERGEQGM